MVDKLILGSSIAAGVVLLALVAYIAEGLYKGRDLVTILGLRRTATDCLPIEEDVNPFADDRFIQKTQRYSIRSHQLSIHSNRSARKKRASQRASRPSPLAVQVYNSEWLMPAQQAKSANDAPENDVPMPEIDERYFATLASPTPTVTTVRMSVAKPEMAQVRGSTTRRIRKEPRSLPKVPKKDKAPSAAKSAPTEHMPKQPAVTPKQAAHTSAQMPPTRWSLISDDDCPPTPKFKLGRSSTDQGQSKMQLERIAENGASTSPGKRPTSAGSGLSSIIHNYSRPPMRVMDEEMGRAIDE